MPSVFTVSLLLPSHFIGALFILSTISLFIFWLIRSVVRASKFSVLKLIEIVILWVYDTIPFGFSLIWHFWASLFKFLSLSVWLKITDEVTVPEMRIWFIV